MKFHKIIHHHIKKHHKKYLLGLSLSGLGIFILKFFVLVTGFFGLLAQKDGVFALAIPSLITALPYVELNSQNITQEPFSCAIDTTTCNLSNKNIVGIASGTFINHTNLETINLSNNMITSIEVGDFNGAVNLESIDLSKNPINFIMTGSFDNFTYLNNLFISDSCNINQTQINTINYYCNSDSEYTNQISCENAGYCASYNGTELSQFTGKIFCESHSCYNPSNTLLQEYTDQMSCESSGQCSDPLYTNQMSCESGGQCSDPLYTNQISCENAGECSDPQHTDQMSCESSGQCSDPLYTNQMSCENAGECYDGYRGTYLSQYTNQVSCESISGCYDNNGNLLIDISDQNSCESNYLCSDDQYTDETSCQNNSSCYHGYRGTYLSQYTNQVSCESISGCYDNNGNLLTDISDQNSCQNTGKCYNNNGNIITEYNYPASCRENGYSWFLNSWYSHYWSRNNRNVSYWYSHYWNPYDNYWNTNNTWNSYLYTWKPNNTWNSNTWKPSKWNSYLYTWDYYTNNSINTDDNYCSIINSSTSEGFIVNLTNNQYQLTGGYYIGYKPLKFTEGKNQILADIIMKNRRYSKITINSGTIITTNGQPYTGLLLGPTELETGGVAGIKNIASLIEFGDPINHIEFSKPITITTSVIGKTIGSLVKVFYNENLDNSWLFHTTTPVIDINGVPYIEFTTDHATYFAIGEEIGSFVINNDDSTTASQNVTLTISASGSQYMRFSNISGSNRSDWESYSGSKSWLLSEGYGEKTVYAEFDIDGDYSADASTFDDIEYTNLLPGQTEGNIYLNITGGVTECVYGTSLDMNAQDVKIGIPYTFSGSFPSAWYCQDYQGIDGGWTLTIQTTDLTNEKGNVISGSNLLISHDPVVVQGDLACTGNNGTPTQFYSAPYEIFEKISESKKICKVSTDNVSLLVNVPANQAPGSYSGTLTLTMNGF
ncbi:MAG: leucine-rich repeat domain-containing protein [Candidatus Absconditabacteria bacterium]|nr:leucine-rich repeat domain-containing protein [Candidatus Absconditabacteria bacterium]